MNLHQLPATAGGSTEQQASKATRLTHSCSEGKVTSPQLYPDEHHVPLLLSGKLNENNLPKRIPMRLKGKRMLCPYVVNQSSMLSVEGEHLLNEQRYVIIKVLETDYVSWRDGANRQCPLLSLRA